MKKLTLKFLITLVLITSIIYLSDKQETYQYQQAVLGTGDSSKYLVSRVIDGDTVELATGEIIRYIGIDTPESVKPNTPVECYSKEASKRTSFKICLC
jgi:endonuclease YncB( thermonuclease family)